MPSPWEKYQQRQNKQQTGTRGRARALAAGRVSNYEYPLSYDAIESVDVDPNLLAQERQRLQKEQAQRMRGLGSGIAGIFPDEAHFRKTGELKLGVDNYALAPSQASLEEDPGFNPWSWTMQKAIAPTLQGWQRLTEWTAGTVATPFSTELRASRDAGVSAGERWRNIDLPTMRIGKAKGEGFGFDVGVKGAIELAVDPIGAATMVFPFGMAFRGAAYPAKKLGALVGKTTGLTRISRKGKEAFEKSAKKFDVAIREEVGNLQKDITEDLWNRNVLTQDHLKATEGGFGNLSDLPAVVTPKTEHNLLMNYDEIMDAKSQLGYTDGILAYINQKATSADKKKMGVFWRALNNPIERFRPSVGAMQTKEGRALYFYNQYKTAIPTEVKIQSDKLKEIAEQNVKLMTGRDGGDYKDLFNIRKTGEGKYNVEAYAPGQEMKEGVDRLTWKGKIDMINVTINRESVPAVIVGKGQNSNLDTFIRDLGELTGREDKNILINVNTDMGIVNLTTPSGFNLGQISIDAANSFDGSVEDIIAGLQNLSPDSNLVGKSLGQTRSEINTSLQQLNKRAEMALDEGVDLGDLKLGNILPDGKYDYQNINFRGFDFKPSATRVTDIPAELGSKFKTAAARKGDIQIGRGTQVGDVREGLARKLEALIEKNMNTMGATEKRNHLINSSELLGEASKIYKESISSYFAEVASYIKGVTDKDVLGNLILRSKKINIGEGVTGVAPDAMDLAKGKLKSLGAGPKGLEDAKKLYLDELKTLGNEMNVNDLVQFSTTEDALLALRKLDKGFKKNQLWVDVKGGVTDNLESVFTPNQWNIVTREIIRQYAIKGKNIDFLGRVQSMQGGSKGGWYSLTNLFKKSDALKGHAQYRDLEQQFGKMASRIGKGPAQLGEKSKVGTAETRKLLNDEFKKLYGTDITKIEKEMPFLNFLDMAGFTVGHSASTGKTIRLYETGYFGNLKQHQTGYLDFFYNGIDELGQLFRESGGRFNEIAEHTNGNYVHHLIQSRKLAATEAEDVLAVAEGFGNYPSPLSPKAPTKARKFTDSLVEGFEQYGIQYFDDPADSLGALTQAIHQGIATHTVANKLKVAAALDLSSKLSADKELQLIRTSVGLVNDIVNSLSKTGVEIEQAPGKLVNYTNNPKTQGYIRRVDADLHKILMEAADNPSLIDDLTLGKTAKRAYTELSDDVFDKFKVQMKKQQDARETLIKHQNLIEKTRKDYDMGKGIFGRQKKENIKRRIVADNGTREGQSVAILEDLLFDDKVAKKIEDTLGITKSNAFDRFSDELSTVGDNIRLIQTGIDIGTPMLQGLPTLVRNPALWGKATKGMFSTIVNPKKKGGDVMRMKFYQENAGTIRRMNRKRVLMASQGQDQFRALSGEGWAGKFLKGVGFDEDTKGVKIAEGFDLGVKRLQQGFEDLGDRIRTGLWESHENQIIGGMSEDAKSLYFKTGQVTGESADIINKQLDELGEYVNQMTGAFSHTQAMIGKRQANFERAFLLFSPAYTRASLGLLGSVLSGRLKGKEAHKAIGRVLGVGVAFHTAVAYAQAEGTGEPLEKFLHLDPTRADFLTVQINDTNVGFGSFWNSTTKLMAQIVSDPAFRGDVLDSPLLMTGAGRGQAGFDEQGIRSKMANNPAVRWLRGRSSPIGSHFWNLGMGANHLGEEMSINSADYFKLDGGVPGDIAPFWIQNFYDQGAESGFIGLPFEFAGLRTYEMPAWEKRTEILNEFSMMQYDELWRDLNTVQRRSIEEDYQAHPSWKKIKQLDLEMQEKRRVIGGGELDIKLQEFRIETGKIDDAYQSEMTDLVHLYVTQEPDEDTKMPAIGSPSELIQQEKLVRADKGARLEALTNVELNPDYKVIERYYDSFDRFDSLERPEDHFADQYSEIYFSPEWDHVGFFDFKGRDEDLQGLLSQWGGDAQELEAYAKSVLFGKRLKHHNVISEYYVGQNKFFDLYYQGSHEAIFTDRYRGEFDDLYDTWRKSSVMEQARLEDQNKRFKKALSEVGAVREEMRNLPGEPNSISLDAFLYRFRVGGVSSLLHGSNRNREEELDQREAIDTYVPEWRVAGQ